MRTPRLNRRQQQALAGIAYGLTNAEIAEYMQLSPESVRSHVHRMLQTLGATNRAHAVALGYRYGLLRGVWPEPRRTQHCIVAGGPR